MLLRVLLLALLATAAAGEDSFDDMVAKTDMANIDQVLVLAQWCKDHNRPTHAREYWTAAIRLDPDNETARSGLGEVKVGDKWVHESQIPPQIVEGHSGSSPSASSSPAPTAAQIAWQYLIPRDPSPDNDFINAYINKLPSIPNDSTEMDSAVATMLMDENLPSALPRLCHALDRPDFNDLYGAANVVMGLVKAGRIESARPLLPFLVKGTTHCSDPDDIAAAVFAIALFKDKRAVPRIIELYDTKKDVVQDACSNAMAAIAALPTPVSKAQAEAWWAKNWNADPHKIFLDQLHSSDPQAQIAAAEALYDLRDKSFVPVALKMLTADDRELNNRAIRLLKQTAGMDWNYGDAHTPEERSARARLAEKWWKDNGERFQFPEPPSSPSDSTPAAPAAPVDHTQEWVGELGSVVGNTDAQAEQSLRASGKAAVPALINGLDNSAAIIRRRCNEILKVITSKDFGFDAHGTDAERAKAIASWKQWAEANLPPPADAGGGGGN